MSIMSQHSKESPRVKDGEILIKKQEDGNYKAWMIKDGKQLEVREIDPYNCLMKLLTHP